MSSEIKINVSGGNAIFGNVVQGDRATVTASVSAPIEQSFRKAGTAVAERGQALGRTQAEIQGALKELERLKSEAAAPAPDTQRGSRILKAIKDNFEWAYPIVKDVAAAAWPALMALVT
jgi:prefoldin subunit 5